VRAAGDEVMSRRLVLNHTPGMAVVHLPRTIINARMIAILFGWCLKSVDMLICI
jgi:hypothetical protein